MRPSGRMTAFEEHRLAGGAIAGDADALQALWQSHRRWVAAVLLAHMPRDAELDDLLQEVALTMVRHVHTVKDPTALKPWLRTVAVNAARSAGRRERVARTKVLPFVAQEARRQADEAQSRGNPAQSDSGASALGIAHSLPPEYREPLLLRAVRGMTYRQIADVLGVPMTTIETRIARARRMVRQELAALEGQSPDHDPVRPAEKDGAS